MITPLLAGTGLVGASLAIARIPNLVESPGLFLALFALAFLCYAAGAWRLPADDGPRSLAVLLAVAFAARLVLAPALPTLSTDAYRYVWDARVAEAGISPYAYAPSARELERLRDADIYPRLNHPTWQTIYPPGAQLFFRMVYRIRPDSVMAMKLAVGLAELVGLAAVFGLLRAGGLPLSRAVIYAWNPLLLVEVWGTGHLDGLVLPAVVGAAWAAMRERHATTGALLGVGALVKLYPLVLLPLVAPAAWAAVLGSFVVVVLAGYVPGLVAGASVLGSLPRYVAEEYFNPGPSRWVVDAPAVAVAVAAAWIMVATLARRSAPLAARAVPLIGGFLLLSPNIFPWYAVWLLPFLACAPSVPWIVFTGTVALAYTFFLQQPWAVPGWARVLELAPLVLGALWWLGARLPAVRSAERSA
jgi:glycosyl transferase family 87